MSTCSIRTGHREFNWIRLSGAADSDWPKQPNGVELTPLDLTFQRDPYPVLDELRGKEPVHLDQMLRRWLLTGHDDIDGALRDGRNSISR